MFELGADSVRLNTKAVVPLFPSACVTAATEIDGRATPSSLMIVPKPVPFSIVAPAAFESTTRKLSFASTAVSPSIPTVTDFVVWPGANTSVPVAGWKSTADVAEPDAVAKATVTVVAEAAESVTSNTAGVVPPLPSVTVAPPIVSVRDPVAPPSSFVIVPRPVPFAIVAPEAFERMRRKVSSVSAASSPVTDTGTDFVV